MPTPTPQPGKPPEPTKPSEPDKTADRLAAIEADNKALRDSLAEHKRANEELLLKLATPTAPTPPVQPSQPTDMKTKWWTDPQAAFQEQAAPMMQSVMQTNYFLMRNQMEQKYAAEFKAWGKEIDEMLRTLNPAYLANPQTWEITIERIRGKHYKDYATNPNLVPANSEPSSPGTPPAPPDPAASLTPDELRWAQRFKLTPQQYAARKSTIKVGV